MAAPELRLDVTLNLAGFRTQLGKLAQASAAYYYPINLSINKRNFEAQLKALSRIKPVIKIEDSQLDGTKARIATLNKSLATLRKATATPIVVKVQYAEQGNAPAGMGGKSRTFRQGLETVNPDAIKRLYKAAADAGMVAFNASVANNKSKIVTALNQAGEDSVTGLLNGLKSKDASVKKAAKNLGDELIQALKFSLQIQSPSKKMEGLGEDAGKGFEIGIVNGLQRAEAAATKRMQAMLDKLAKMALMAAGYSPEQIAAGVAGQRQSRALPQINWPSSSPSGPPIGPSSSGRLLSGGADYAMLRGTSFASQKLLVGDILSAGLKEALRDAANTFVDQIRSGLNQAMRAVSVRDLGARMQPSLSGGRVAGLLGPAPGRAPSTYATGRLGREGETQAELFARRTAEAYTRSAQRSIDVMGGGSGRPSAPYSYAYRAARPASAIVPYAAGGALVPTGGGGGNIPPSSPGGGPSFGGMGGNLGRAMGGINLPGAGVVREMAGEFAEATKQVLLFGTAYKALAFITAFPGQVGAAVGALQSFRNTLKAISPTAEEAKASNQLILDLVGRYNIPLQSARDGFTKLYASMQPAGFSGNEVRDLFTGISKAAATFGMSADKVDRVNYAFAQMASKGQVMSEELKGQLGDVLPGAMGIFAEAAGFKGPDAIQKFSKALEDGAYKGQAMKTLLTNVGVLMNKEFGPGAEGAARTFQGSMNRMQNSLLSLYEAFEPAAVGFLNAVVMPLTDGIKQVADGFNAFFTGQAAQTAGGSAFAQQLEKLRPTFEGLRQNIIDLIPSFQAFGKILLEVGQVFLQIASNPFVGYLARIYLAVLPLTIALRVLNLQVLIPLIASFLRAIPAFVAFNAAMISGASTNKALQLSMQLTGQTAGVTAGKIRLVSAALATLGSTVILAGIGLLIERFLMMKSAIDGVRQSTQQMLSSVSSMANAGAIKDLRNVAADTKKQVKVFEELKTFTSGGSLNTPSRRLTEAGAKKMEELGLGGFVGKDILGKPYVNDFVRASKIIEERLQGLRKTAGSVQEKLPLAEKVAADLAKQAKQAQSTAIIPAGTDEAQAKSDKAKQQSLESYHSLQDRLAKNFTQDQIDRMEKEYQARVDRINAEFDLREARANSFQKEAIRYEREIAAIELKKQKALLDASNEVIKAQGSVAGGAMTSGNIGAGAARLPGSISGRLDASGQNGADMPVALGNIMRSYHNGIVTEINRAGNNGNYVVVEFLDDLGNKLEATYSHVAAAVKVGQSVVGGQTIGRFDASGRTFGAHNSIDINSPGTNGALQRNQEGAAARRSADILVTGRVQGMAGAPRKITGDEKRDVEASQKTQLAIAQQSLAVQIAEAQAIRDAAVAWAQYTNAITPIEEQKLQNSLLAKKNELVKSGMTEDAIDKEMKYFETQEKTAIAIEVVNKEEKAGIIDKTRAAEKLAELRANLAQYNIDLAENIALQNQLKFNQTMASLGNQLAMARALTPDQEMRTQIAQEGYTGDEAESVFQARKTLQGAQKLKEDMQGIASSISDAFGNAFKGIITGSMTAQEALAGMFQSIADHFADMVAKMIAEWIKMMILKGIEAIINPMAGLGNLGGGGALSGATSAASAGLSFDPGGMAGVSMPWTFAGGGIAPGGFRAFADGGIVTGPTLGLVGEGRYNEAVVPLPDGKSIPVDLGGAMGGGSAAPTVIVNVDAKGSQVEGNEQNANQLGRVISAAVQTELIKQQRPGGLLAGKR